jgi:hypothetical protein
VAAYEVKLRATAALDNKYSITKFAPVMYAANSPAKDLERSLRAFRAAPDQILADPMSESLRELRSCNAVVADQREH